MHSYLKAIGFSNIKRKRHVDALIEDVKNHPDEEVQIQKSGKGDTVFAERRKDYGKYFGIAVRGEYTEEGEFDTHYYFPYLSGTGITTDEKVDIAQHADKYAFAGICDDVKIGVSLIFYLQNMVDYVNFIAEKLNFKNNEINGQTTLSALSVSGKILLPTKKDQFEMDNHEYIVRDRNHLIEAAREGDEEAIENLTLEDMDTYSMISRRIMEEDILSIVTSYFMPYGIESDQYSILGEILDYERMMNQETKEEIYRFTLNCNDLIFDTCINASDLEGEPAIGRRFKGNIWMQGKVHMST